MNTGNMLQEEIKETVSIKRYALFIVISGCVTHRMKVLYAWVKDCVLHFSWLFWSFLELDRCGHYKLSLLCRFFVLFCFNVWIGLLRSLIFLAVLGWLCAETQTNYLLFKNLIHLMLNMLKRHDNRRRRKDINNVSNVLLANKVNAVNMIA